MKKRVYAKKANNKNKSKSKIKLWDGAYLITNEYECDTKIGKIRLNDNGTMDIEFD